MSDKESKQKTKLTPKPESIETIQSKLREVKGLDNIVEFISNLDDEFFGFKTDKVGLLDIMGDQDKEFSFFETYYNSSAAEKNRELSITQTDRINELRTAAAEDDAHILNKLMFKDTPEVRKILLENIQDLVGGQD